MFHTRPLFYVGWITSETLRVLLGLVYIVVANTLAPRLRLDAAHPDAFQRAQVLYLRNGMYSLYRNILLAA